MTDLMTHTEMMELLKEAVGEKKIDITKEKSSSTVLSSLNIRVEKDKWSESGYTMFVNFHKVLQRWVAFGDSINEEKIKMFKQDFKDVIGCVNILVIDDEKKLAQVKATGKDKKCRRLVLKEGVEEKKEKEEAKEKEPAKREPLALEEAAATPKPPAEKKKGKK